MRFAEEHHEGSRLADAATDAEGDLLVDDGLVIGVLQNIELIGDSRAAVALRNILDPLSTLSLELARIRT